MRRYFNVAGACDPKLHYMVDLKGRLQEIKQLIDRGAYPYLVSKLCNIMDERLRYIDKFRDLEPIWGKEGFLEAVKILLSEKNSLFESLINKLSDYPELKSMLYDILFHGGEVFYTIGLEAIENAEMFGFVRKEGANAVIANRIFETILYNWFLSAKEIQGNDLYKAALQDKNQFFKLSNLLKNGDSMLK